MTLPSVRLAAAGPRLSELSLDRAEMDLRFLFGQLRLGQIGSLLFQGGALQTSNLTGTWKEGAPSSATGNIRNLVLPVMGGQLNLNDLTTVSLADRSSINAEQLRLDTAASPNITGRIGSAFLVIRGERKFSISRWLDFVPQDGTTVIAQDPGFPLTIAANQSFLTGRYLIYGPYKKLNLRSTDVDGTFAEGLADFDIVAREDKTFSAVKISFDGQIEHLNLPFGSDSKLNLQDGSIKSDQNGLKMELAPDRPPRIDNTLTVARSRVAQSDLRFNRASKLRATAGSVEIAHLLFSSRPAQKVTTLLTNLELRFNDPTSFIIPDIATIESSHGSSLIAGRSSPLFELSSDTPSPTGPFTIDLPSSRITLQGGTAPLIQNGMARLPLSNGRDGVVTGSGMSIDGNLSANLDATHLLQGTIRLADGMLHQDSGASPILEFSLGATLQPLALGRLKTTPQTLPLGQPKPGEWFFPADFDVSLVNQSLTSPIRIRLEGNRLSTLSALPINLSLSVPPGLGKYKDPNNLAKGTKNKGDGKDKQELWRKEIAVSGYHCKESSFLNSTPGPGTSTLNSAVSILNGDVLFSFPDGTLPAQATPVTLSGCAKDAQIFAAVSQALFTVINNHRKRDVLAAPVSASDPPDKLFGVFLLLESVNDISSTDQHALRFRVAP